MPLRFSAPSQRVCATPKRDRPNMADMAIGRVCREVSPTRVLSGLAG